MKIGVVGPGAVGGYYGAKLSRDGHEVHFLLRSDYETVRRNGVQILSPEGDFNARPKAAASPGEIGHCDLVLIGLKTTANSQFARLLPQLVSAKTAVLTLQNGLGNEEALAKLFPLEQILGGLCFVCLNRVSPGVIHHIAHGKIELGEFQRWPEPRTHDIATAFRHSGIPCSVRDDLNQAHWEKLVWNIPFNGLSVASGAGLEAFTRGLYQGRTSPCLTTDKLLANEGWIGLVRGLMMEVITAGNANNCRIENALAEKFIDKTRVMGAYKPSTMVDFLEGREIELDALFFEPLRRAKAKGLISPILEQLCNILNQLSGSQSQSFLVDSKRTA